MGLSSFLAVYLLGGLTFVPLVIAVVFLHAYLTQPVRGEVAGSDASAAKAEGAAHGSTTPDAVFDSLPDELKTRTHVPDVAAGYFAVCREYVPGGINGKPPERTTPAGAVVAAESPSVYQSMYRSIFDRNKTTSPSMDGAAGKSKKARNVFYVVLRLGILMLYDDQEQLEVRHVISLAHYDVDIYAGGDPIPEGELWIKRNCIRLVQRAHLENGPADSKPFFLFSDNCSEKEDFYHAILQSQDQRADIPRSPPTPLKFDTADLVRLVQQLHASEENLHTRWINALIGRLFLALYKTEQVEQFIWNKITKKIARVPKPALISQIQLQKVDMGTLPPFITNPKLKEFTVDGDMTVEADVSYKGNFRVEISAIARIELGSRFKPREVTLVLATTLKKLEGHILLRMKPPPSNRLWVTFETAPKMELSLEPIVSSRQITYGVILRAIESRLREVVSETLVLPNWDDMPFKDTESNPFRGGIWTNDAKKERTTESLDGLAEHDIAVDERHSDSEASDSEVTSPSSIEIKSIRTAATTSSMDSTGTQTTVSSAGTGVKGSIKPKAMRSSSFTGTATPTVNVNATNASATKSEQRERAKDAASSMKTISMSQAATPADTPVGSPPKNKDRRRKSSSGTHEDDQEDATLPLKSPHAAQSATTLESFDSHSTAPKQGGSKHASSQSLPRNAGTTHNKKQQIFNQTVTSATAAAKKWFTKQQPQHGDHPPLPSPSLFTTFPKSSTGARDYMHHHSADDAHHDDTQSIHSHLSTSTGSDANAPLGSPANPIGRGQPIPEGPPSKPEKRNSGWAVPTAATIANLTRRKPVAGSSSGRPAPAHSRSHSQSLSHGAGFGNGYEHSTANGNGNGFSSSTDRDRDSHGLSTSLEERDRDRDRERDGNENPPPLPARTPTTPRFPPSPAAHAHGHERKASVGTAAMGGGHRRKSSAAASPMPLAAAVHAASTAASIGTGVTSHANPHPNTHTQRNRKRRSVTESAGSSSLSSLSMTKMERERQDTSGVGGAGADDDESRIYEGLFVVQAPVDTSAPGSPAVRVVKKESLESVGSRRSGGTGTGSGRERSRTAESIAEDPMVVGELEGVGEVGEKGRGLGIRAGSGGER